MKGYAVIEGVRVSHAGYVRRFNEAPRGLKTWEFGFNWLEPAKAFKVSFFGNFSEARAKAAEKAKGLGCDELFLLASY